MKKSNGAAIVVKTTANMVVYIPLDAPLRLDPRYGGKYDLEIWNREMWERLAEIEEKEAKRVEEKLREISL